MLLGAEDCLNMPLKCRRVRKDANTIIKDTQGNNPRGFDAASRAINCLTRPELSGYIGGKSDGDPGVKTLWRGFRQLQVIMVGKELDAVDD